MAASLDVRAVMEEYLLAKRASPQVSALAGFRVESSLASTSQPGFVRRVSQKIRALFRVLGGVR